MVNFEVCLYADTLQQVIDEKKADIHVLLGDWEEKCTHKENPNKTILRFKNIKVLEDLAQVIAATTSALIHNPKAKIVLFDEGIYESIIPKINGKTKLECTKRLGIVIDSLIPKRSDSILVIIASKAPEQEIQSTTHNSSSPDEH